MRQIANRAEVYLRTFSRPKKLNVSYNHHVAITSSGGALQSSPLSEDSRTVVVLAD